MRVCLPPNVSYKQNFLHKRIYGEHVSHKALLLHLKGDALSFITPVTMQKGHLMVHGKYYGLMINDEIQIEMHSEISGMVGCDSSLSINTQIRQDFCREN